jgi:hypothetical protein
MRAGEASGTGRLASAPIFAPQYWQYDVCGAFVP